MKKLLLALCTGAFVMAQGPAALAQDKAPSAKEEAKKTEPMKADPKAEAKKAEAAAKTEPVKADPKAEAAKAEPKKKKGGC